jgi:nicotinate phosphoribosyltransferase
VRLDSGDLAWLSIEARRILDEGGFPDAKIVASNELDERVIESLREQGARIDTWGVGTRLSTGGDEPALGGVYKLGAIREPDGAWSPRLKLSERLEKVSDPGVLQVRRFRRDGKFLADMLWSETAPPPGARRIVDPLDPTRMKELPADADAEDLLVPVFRAGRLVREPESLDEIRRRARAQLASLDPAITRLLNPHEYPVGLEPALQQLKLDLIAKARAAVTSASHAP